MQQLDTSWTVAWTAVRECGREDRLLRARLRWIATLLHAHGPELTPGPWLLAELESAITPPRARLECAPLLCGSGPSCAVRLRGPSVAGRHLVVSKHDSADAQLEVLEGDGATWVNGAPVRHTITLHSGDIIQAGNARLAYVTAE